MIRRQRGGVQPDPLDRDDVRRAADELARSQGLSALTVRAVAERLGVTGPAIYYHVPGGKRGLVQLVVDHAVEEVHRAELFEYPGETGLDTLERFIVASGRAERRYPGIVLHSMSTGIDSALATKGSDFAARQLLRSGFSTETAAKAFAAIHAFMTGWACQQWPSASLASERGQEALAGIVTRVQGADDEVLLRSTSRALLYGLHATLVDGVDRQN